jgi:uncharacterized protein YcnI
LDEMGKLKFFFATVLTVLALLCFSGAAYAHVNVFPKEAVRGSYEKFTVRVPSEGGKTTAEVRVRFPDSVDISRVEPKPGWSYEWEQDENGRFTGIVWKATDGGLGPTEFAEFNLSGKISDDAQELVWKAYQTYDDGSVVEWVGAPDSDTPASVTTVIEGAANSDGHGHASGGSAEAEVQTEETGNGGWVSVLKTVSLVLSIAALLLSLYTLIIVLRRSRS